MQGKTVISLTSVLCLLLLLQSSPAHGNTTFAVGRRQSGDVELQSSDVAVNPLSTSSLNDFKTYVGDNESIITRVEVEDSKKLVAPNAALVHGGPGHTFATLVFSAKPGFLERTFKVTVYGLKA